MSNRPTGECTVLTMDENCKIIKVKDHGHLIDWCEYHHQFVDLQAKYSIWPRTYATNFVDLADELLERSMKKIKEQLERQLDE